MIVDDPIPPPPPPPAPPPSSDFDDYIRLAQTLRYPDGIVATESSAIQSVQALRDGETLARAAAENARAMTARELREGERLKSVVGNTAAGHAARFCDESMDGLTKFVNRCMDNVMGELGAAESSMMQTPLRPVNSPDEAAMVLAMPAVAGAMALIEDKAEFTATSGESGQSIVDRELQPVEISPGTEFDSIQRRAAEAVARIAAANREAANQTARGPNVSGGTIGVNDAGAYCSNASTMREIYAEYVQLLNSGATIQLAGQLATSGSAGETCYEIDVILPHGSQPPTYRTMICVFDPSYNVGLDPVDFAEYPTPQESQAIFPWIPNGSYWHLGGQFPPCSGFPIPPAAPPSPPAPPAPPPPPLVGAPTNDSECCPPHPAEREEKTASIPVRGSTNSWNEVIDFCFALNTMGGENPDIDGTGGVPQTEPGLGNVASESLGLTTWASSLLDASGESLEELKKRMPKAFSYVGSPAVGSPTEGMVNSFAIGQALTIEHCRKFQRSNAALYSEISGHATALGAANWAETVTGAPLNYLSHAQMMRMRYLSPQFMITQDSIDELYLRNAITDGEWECRTRSHGNLAEVHRQARDAKQTITGIGEIIDLYYRKVISSDQLIDEMRKRGVIDRKEIERWVALRQQFPTMPDLIRFMVRDVENPRVVNEGKLFDGFDENYGGRIKEWAEWAGVPEEVFRYHWAAHWDLPSPTSANEMLRRLRPGRVPKELETTIDQVKSLYAAADYAPAWRDRMIAVSYLTPTRTDIKQGYNQGVYDREEVIELLQDTGLDKEGAETVARLYDAEKLKYDRSVSKANTLWSVSRVLNKFAEGVISEVETRSLLEMLSLKSEVIDDAIESTKIYRQTQTRAKCIRSVRRRFFVGAIDQIRARREIASINDDVVSAREIVEGWKCEISSSLQEVPARKNLEWAIRGVITLDELRTRLERLRYSPEDVIRFEAEAVDKIREAQAKAAKAAAREQLADARQRLAELRRLIREAEKRKKELEDEKKKAQPKESSNDD